jgi:hypothetical protein
MEMSARVRTAASFVRLVQPFDVTRPDAMPAAELYENAVVAIRTAIDARGAPLWRDLDLPTDMLLTHCSNHLNCWNGELDASEQRHEYAHFWRLDPSQLATHGALDRRRRWRAARGRGPGAMAVSFCIADAFLVLFRPRVGFVALEVIADSREPEDWLFLANQLRHLGGPRGGRATSSAPTISVDAAGDALPFFTPAVAEASGGGEAVSTGASTGQLHEVFDWLASTSLPGFPRGQPWVAGSALPYMCLFVDRTDRTAGTADDDGRTVAVDPIAARARRFLRADQALGGRNADRGVVTAPYTDDSTFWYSLDGGGFYASSAPDSEFFTRTLPDHLRRYYFLNFLFVLHQRLILMRLSEAIAWRWVGGPLTLGIERREGATTPELRSDEARLAVLEHDLTQWLRIFEELRDELLDFSARGNFLQLMHTQSHHVDYETWQEVFEVRRSFHEVDGELQAIYGALGLRFEEIAQLRRSIAEEQARAAAEANQALEGRRSAIQEAFTYILAVFTVVSIALAFLGVSISGVTDDGIDARWLTAITAAAGIVGSVIAYLVHRWTSR